MDSVDTSVDLERISQGRHSDPFAVLGRHQADDRIVVRVYIPYAIEVTNANIKKDKKDKETQPSN